MRRYERGAQLMKSRFNPIVRYEQGVRGAEKYIPLHRFA